MNYRRIGQSGLKISDISIGGWLTYGGSVADKKTPPIIRKAIECGINFIDLSDVYSKGNAETVIGNIINDYTRSDLVISSKVFWPMSDNINDRGLSRKHIIESVDKSLKRLGTDYLDLYYCHRFDPEVPMEEIARSMNDLICRGKILYWGTSVWPAEYIEQAVGICEKYNLHKPIVEQPRYNMIDRHVETDIMPATTRNGMGLTVWSPLAQGILSGKYNNGVPEGSRGDTTAWLKHDLIDSNIEKVKKLAKLAGDNSITISQMALAWILRKQEVSCAIIGATDPKQVEENVAATDINLDRATLKEIEKILDNKPTRSLM